MKIILFLTIIIFFGCFTTAEKTASYQLRIIRFTDSYRDTDSTGVVETDSGGFKIIYYNDMVIYETKAVPLVIKESKMVGDTITNELVPGKDTVFTFFATKKGLNKGIRYNSLKDGQGKIFNKDSLFKELLIDGVNEKFYSVDLGKPIKTIKDVKTGVEIECYVDKKETKYGRDTTF